ncbi:hypothetical protein [Catelliglobosispora koreensis]|uniref:hypothetical protein n=1 Tax=Catelliglobosispora koreensis TaxID=129052 RepID=UPI000362969E|nr:hypothetical protein [Catelliglobosispora koreensis]
MSTLEGEAAFYVERGALSCKRCGDCNYDENTLICITCTHPDDPSSKAYLDVSEPTNDKDRELDAKWDAWRNEGDRLAAEAGPERHGGGEPDLDAITNAAIWAGIAGAL